MYDQTNSSQNILTAARELQQVNNEIQSLDADQGTWRASHTALLMQAQRIAYGDTTIDQACTQNYPKTYSGSTSSRQLLADFQDAMRVQAGAVLPAVCVLAAWQRALAPG